MNRVAEKANRGAGAWQRSNGAMWFLLLLTVAAMVWNWCMSLPLALDGHAGAVENLLTSFAAGAVMVAVIAVGYGKPKVLWMGGGCLAVMFYGSSLFMDELITGNNVGVAMRVGAMATLAMALAGWRLAVGSAKLR